jgi:hypothetical protein
MTTRSTDSIHSPVTVPVQPAVVIPPDVHEMAARLGVSQYLPQIIDLTREIFGTFSRVTVLEDPEFLGDDHIIFHVPANCTNDEDRDIEEQLDKENAWGKRMLEIIPRSPQVYLVFAEFPS